MPLASHPLITPFGPRFIHGAVEVEKTDAGFLPHRLPAWARARSRDPQLALAAAQGSGVQLHPDGAGHRLIGEHFAELVLGPSHAAVAYREVALD